MEDADFKEFSLLEDLPKLPNPLFGGERRKMAQEILERQVRWRDFGHIPLGGWDVGYNDWPSLSHVKEVLARHERFYALLQEVFGDSPPPVFTQLYKRFRRNSQQMLKLTGIDKPEMFKTPTIEFFPYFDDLESSLRQSCQQGAWQNGVRLDDLVFQLEFVARGGWGEIYKVRDKTGKEFALKLFHPQQKLNRYHQEGRYRRVEAMFHNVWQAKDVVSQSPFTALRILPHTEGEWYLMDFFQGTEVQDLIVRRKHPHTDKELTRRILLTYAGMLQSLHPNFLFGDNKWRSVIVGEEEVKICDYDLLVSKETVQDALNPSNHMSTREYSSREHLLHGSSREDTVLIPRTPSSDLEGFALMIDEYFSEMTWAEEFRLKDYEFRQSRVTEAEDNKRKYPQVRAARIPRQIRQLVVPLIQYPRDDSITAQDFISAINLDFR